MTLSAPVGGSLGLGFPELEEAGTILVLEPCGM